MQQLKLKAYYIFKYMATDQCSIYFKIENIFYFLTGTGTCILKPLLYNMILICALSQFYYILL